VEGFLRLGVVGYKVQAVWVKDGIQIKGLNFIS